MPKFIFLALYLSLNTSNCLNVKKISIMKTTNNTLTTIVKAFTLILFVSLLSSCEGPIGPQGNDGGLVYADVYEIEGNFTSENEYRFGYTFPGNGIYSSDAVLVYILWEQADGEDVWRLLPQTVVTDNNGMIIYNADYTKADVQVFLEFTIDASDLNTSETDNQVFKIVVVPGDYAAINSVDKTDINTILDNPDINVDIMEKVNIGVNN